MSRPTFGLQSLRDWRASTSTSSNTNSGNAASVSMTPTGGTYGSLLDARRNEGWVWALARSLARGASMAAGLGLRAGKAYVCLLYTSDAADD